MDIQIGYEVEFLSPLSHNDIYPRLREIIDVHRTPQNYQKWYLGFDGSLRGSRGRGEFGHELVSPIMPLEKGLQEMERLFKWMSENNHYTNSSCGFHVGVSVTDIEAMKKMNELKLLVLLEHANILRKFHRTTSNYCKNLKKTTLDIVRQNSRRWNENENTWHGPKMDFEEKIRKCIPKEKFSSANLSKLMHNNHPYVEFRAMGGEAYHERFDEIKDTIINQYVDVILSACDPNKDIEKYARRKDLFFAEAEKIVSTEREKHAAEIEKKRKAEEKRVRPLIERDLQRRTQRSHLAYRAYTEDSLGKKEVA